MNDFCTNFIQNHITEKTADLALSEKFPTEKDKQFCLQQIQARQKAKNKLPDWYLNFNLIFPKPLSVEQASSHLCAIYKANLPKGNCIVDLTGGMGIDSLYFAKNGLQTTYVELDSDLCQIAAHNFKALNVAVDIENDSAEHYLENMVPTDCIYLDPDRRSHGEKMVQIEDCHPNVIELQSLILKKSNCCILKLSPMINMNDLIEKIPNLKEIHIVSVANECKEIITVSHQEAISPQVFCVNFPVKKLPQKFDFYLQNLQKSKAIIANQLETYLYEPNASILKINATHLIGAHFGFKKLHQNSHLLTADFLNNRFSGRCFKIKSCFSLNKKDIATHLKGINKANITIRNFPLTEAELRKKLKLEDGGDDYLFATTLCDNSKVLILCEKAN